MDPTTLEGTLMNISFIYVMKSGKFSLLTFYSAVGKGSIANVNSIYKLGLNMSSSLSFSTRYSLGCFIYVRTV